MPYIGDIFLGQGVSEPYRSNRANITDNNMFGRTTPEPLSASTKKLFDAIDDENLEAFKQALADGAKVNAFDRGYTPLMTIVTDLSACSEMETEKKYHSMVGLLLLDQDINVNVRGQIDGNTVLHLAMCFQQKKTLQLLLSHPNINTNITNKEKQSPSKCARQNRAEHLIIEIQKAQKGKELLNALASRNIYRAKTLLNQELNPNCWRRNQNGEIETSLSLIIKSCLQTITEDKEEVLTKLLKHKELDFSQIKPIPAIEQNIQLKRIIEQAIKGRLIDTINKKDLDDVKKLVEDNCFINCAIVIAALGDVNNPTEPIKKCLNEKFPASVERPLAGMNDIPVGFEELVHKLVDGREKTEAQLAKKEKELSDTRQELNKRNNEIREQQNRISELERELDQAKAQLTEENRKLNNTRKESGIHQIGIGKEGDGRAVSPNRKQNNYALTFFILCGICTGGACLTIVDYPEVSAGLAAVALGLFLVGYFLYKGNEKDRGPGSATDNPQVKRSFYSSSRFC